MATQKRNRPRKSNKARSRARRSQRRPQEARNSVPIYMVGLVGGRSIFTQEGEIDRGHPAIIRLADQIQDRIIEANRTEREEV